MNFDYFYVVNKLLLILVLAFLCCSCYYDSKEELYPSLNTGLCDTADVSFSSDIKPVITGHCYGCHSNGNAPFYGAGIALEDYPETYSAAMDGSLYGSVEYDPEYEAMPPDYRLDSCSVLMIRAWINQNAKNN